MRLGNSGRHSGACGPPSSAGEPPARMVGPGPGSHRHLRLGPQLSGPHPRLGTPGGQAPSSRWEGESPHSRQLQPLWIRIAVHNSQGPQLHLDAYVPFPRWGNRGTRFLGTGGPYEREDFLARSTRCSLFGNY